MSHRPVEEKRRRKVAKAFRRQPLPAFIDPVAWLVDNGHAAGKQEARTLVLAGKLKSESHTVGVGDGLVESGNALLGSVYKPGKIVVLVPAEMRGRLSVVA